MLSRRQTFVFTAMMATLAACQQPPGTPTGTIAPPTIEQVKAFLNAVSPELPIFITELQDGKAISAAQAVQANQYVGQLQILITQLDQSTGANPEDLVNRIGMLLATIMSFIPQAAPFIPLLITVQAVISAFLAQQAMTSPAGAPEPVPTPPTMPQMRGLHDNTRSFRR